MRCHPNAYVIFHVHAFDALTQCYIGRTAVKPCSGLLYRCVPVSYTSEAAGKRAQAEISCCRANITIVSRHNVQSAWYEPACTLQGALEHEHRTHTVSCGLMTQGILLPFAKGLAWLLHRQPAGHCSTPCWEQSGTHSCASAQALAPCYLPLGL